MFFDLFFVILFGLVMGSFLSAFTYRFPKNIDFVKGRSFCPKCKAKIGWTDNIPLLSFILLKGKCSKCGKRISFRYPLLEILSALSFLLIYFNYRNNIADLFIYLFIYLITVSIMVIDFEEGIIPDELNFLGFVVSFFYILLFRNSFIFQHIFWGFALSSFMLLIHLFTKGKGMGLGDVKFALFPGSFLVFPLNLIWLFLSFIIGSVVGIFMILFKKAKFGKPIPFGPFLGVSFIIVLIWGKNLVEWIIPILLK